MNTVLFECRCFKTILISLPDKSVSNFDIMVRLFSHEIHVTGTKEWSLFFLLSFTLMFERYALASIFVNNLSFPLSTSSEVGRFESVCWIEMTFENSKTHSMYIHNQAYSSIMVSCRAYKIEETESIIYPQPTLILYKRLNLLFIHIPTLILYKRLNLLSIHIPTLILYKRLNLLFIHIPTLILYK